MIKEQKLPGDYIAGFIDGEGCFILNFRCETKIGRTNQNKYFRWIPYFGLTLRSDDVGILRLIKNTLDCGNVYLTKNGLQAQYFIQDISDLYQKVVPFFTTHPLRAKKRGDFLLWSQALEIVYKKKINKELYLKEDHDRLEDIRNKMSLLKNRKSYNYKHSYSRA